MHVSWHGNSESWGGWQTICAVLQSYLRDCYPGVKVAYMVSGNHLIKPSLQLDLSDFCMKDRLQL